MDNEKIIIEMLQKIMLGMDDTNQEIYGMK